MNSAKQDDELDETIEETFPASDPPANTVETGVHIQPATESRHEIEVVDNTETGRFEAVVDGQLAYLAYERRGGTFVLVHTEVPEELRGRGIAGRLAEFGLQRAQASGLPVVVECPFVRSYMKRNRPSGTSETAG
jgi:predicted GNAT family acetyltransferase